MISIIVPVYNAEKYLEQCLNSLLKQTYQNLEIICVNDGSTDKSGRFLEQFQKNDFRIKVINKTNEGVSKARNMALEVASGEFLMFVDADDWIDKNTCERILNCQKQTQADVVMWPYMSEHKHEAVPKAIFPENDVVFLEDEVREKIHRRFIGLVGEELRYPEKADSLCPVWGKLYKRKLIEQNKIRFIDIRKIGSYEDGLFNLEVFLHVKKAVYIQEYFYHYRRTNVASETSGYKETLSEQWESLYQIMENYIHENQLPSIYEEALENRIALGILGLGINLMASTMNLKEKRREMKRLISRPIYQRAIKQLTLKYFPFYWKLFYGCSKWNCSIGILGMLLIIQKLIQ